MSNIKAGEVRYYQWGDEPRGFVSIWTVNERHEAENLGRMPREEAYAKGLVMECPYH